MGYVYPAIRVDTAAAQAAEGEPHPLLVNEDGELMVAGVSGGGGGEVTIAGTPSVIISSGSLSVATHVTSSPTLYSSVARTATPTPVVQTNLYAKGVLVFVRVTAGAATPSVVPTIEVVDPLSNATKVILTGTAITSTAATSYTYCVYPGMLTADTFYDKITNAALPMSWQLSMTHGDADSLTYTASANYLL